MCPRPSRTSSSRRHPRPASTPRRPARTATSTASASCPARSSSGGTRWSTASGSSAATTGGSPSTRNYLKKDPTLEWVTPGHPLFEAVRDEALDRVHDDLKKGAVFFDIQRNAPALLDVFAASVKDGRGRTLHRRLFVVETDASSQMAVRQPTIFHEITPAPKDTKPVSTDESAHPRPQQGRALPLRASA